ncbi:hypothetical protein E6C60_2566 [Paenibacillus algicola]|uniref:Uncharacterized protein n=1 Tax=Paenibacillus algicola TaxID=2565926 RepID=A0A4P8XLD2_9BACL|nr:hypothetical protein E6C60_2566 [Paenibacillus algicola]
MEPEDYEQDFREGVLGRINPETGGLEFYYPDPNAPTPQEPVYQPPLSDQVKVLQEKIQQTDIENKLALMELYQLITGE